MYIFEDLTRRLTEAVVVCFLRVNLEQQKVIDRVKTKL